ncbi:MAG TPA: hypothetical protein VF046_07180 [Gemmatimonadales bacterium]
MREVNRLLAQLDHSAPRGASEPAHVPGGEGGHALSRPGVGRRPRMVVGTAHAEPLTRFDLAALWARILLALGLGAAMTQWPYLHGCGWPLAAYLGAVAMVLIAGAGLAFDSWRLRSGVVHVLAVGLAFWAIVLVAEQALPRVGYAAEPATWSCGIPEVGATQRRPAKPTDAFVEKGGVP